MADVLRAYSLLAASSPRSQVCDVLRAITEASPFAIEQSNRADLIQLILKDLKTAGSKSSRLTQKDVSQALLAVKTLGKSPPGSEYLSTPAGLSMILAIATNLKDDREAFCEALRCIANTMLLHDEARYKLVSKEVGGGDICVGWLYKATDTEVIFVLSRILFLSTASPSTFLLSLVEDKRQGHPITEIISTKLDVIMVRLLSGAKSARDAMTDLLKFAFNLLLHYPKLVSLDQPRTSSNGRARTQTGTAKHDDDHWSPKLDGLLAPLLRVYHSLPPTFPSPLAAPLTHVIHCLIAIPVSDKSLLPVWLGPSQQQSHSTTSHARPLSMAISPSSSAGRPVTAYARIPPQNLSMGIPSSRHSIDAPPSPNPYTSNGPSLPLPVPHKPGNTTPPKQTTLDRALSVLSAATGKHRRSPSPLPAGPRADVVQRTMDLLEVSFAHYMPGCVEPDSPGVRERIRTESASGSLSSASGSGSSSGMNSSNGSWKTATMSSASSNPASYTSPYAPASMSPANSGSTPDLSDILSPLLTLLTRLCKADSKTRIRIASWLIPPSLFAHHNPPSNRNSTYYESEKYYTGTPLYKLPNFLGRCLRVLTSTHRTTAKLREGVGELLWIVSGEDPWVLSSRIGYGCVRDLLKSKGIMREPMTPAPTPPPKESRGILWDGTEVMDIRPLNGSGNGNTRSLKEEMSEEEKEKEMDKMFGLLDRLERVGGRPRNSKARTSN
ncbi:hypothetical protein V5O48_015531 [Marasmius crinis-equi]|uniref:Uncharacterized protein n=1 Tax=Marasmius crinis-equi TaxID=585013 RepID=A0ABR3EUA0_9AGAR